MEEKLQDKMFTNRQLVSLIIPLFIDQILNAAVGIADVIMVATLGEYAVSGVSLVDSINILLFALLNALGTGGAVVASQYLGRKDRKMAENTAVQLIYVMLGVSSFITAVLIIFCRPILSGIFGKVEDSVMDASLRYFWITMLALLALPFIVPLQQFSAPRGIQSLPCMLPLSEMQSTSVEMRSAFLC